MPICTTCTAPVEHLYTVYQSAHNLRLEQCTRSSCLAFVDPYVEYDTLALLLDLILLKRGVYRHLLFNRGTPPRRETGPSAGDKAATPRIGSDSKEREHKRRVTVGQLGVTLILIDAFIRWSNHHPLGAYSGEISPLNQEAWRFFLKTLLGCFIETISFHIGVTCFCALVLRLLSALPQKQTSTVRSEFRASHVPLTLLYSSVTKLFLLLMLSIWRPENTVSTPTSWTIYSSSFLNTALELLDEDKLDRQWVVRNVLGGMAAGFGLRVVLDCHPIITALVILAGWGVKTWVSSIASVWIGGMEGLDDTWLAYSIP
ncbi:Arv1-domain-containing protein [Ramaria rubella]|nr:Arv1-domain-containing protein [Ramaria rubella]